MEVRKIRVLRLKYHISLIELSQTSGLSPQRLSQLELYNSRMTAETARKLTEGLEKVILRREKEQQNLWDDYERHRSSLMEMVRETSYVL